MTDSHAVKSWIPVALTEGLPPGGVMRAVIGDDDMAVWRGHDGLVQAFNNRCPHRGMRLSHGFVRGNRLSCLYHGWQYDGEGSCRYIPAHPDLEPPKTLCATHYGCREFDGVVWVSSGEEPFPLAETFGGTGVRSLAVNRASDDIRQMLEFAHLPGRDGGEPATSYTAVHSEARRIVLKAAKQPDAPVLIVSLQPLTGERTMLHLQCDSASPETKVGLSRWAERARWFAENPGAGGTSWNPFGQSKGAAA